MALHAAHQEAGDGLDWRAQVDATMQHLALLKRKADRLEEARRDSEVQLAHALAAAHRAGLASDAELGAVHDELAPIAASGCKARWNAVMAIPWDRAKGLRNAAPNGPDGSWFGPNPIGRAPAPPPGACVVYVLFDAANVPCYLGSSNNFRARLSGHRNARIPFTSWVAYPAPPDRESAYQLEERLLAEHRPYLNKKVCR